MKKGTPMPIRPANRAAAIVAAAIFAVTPVLRALPQAAPPQAKPAAAKPAPGAKPAAAAPVTDPGWPRNYITPSQGRVTIFEPQIASWANQKELIAYSAAQYQSNGSAATAKPALGTIKLEAATKVSLEQRLVSFANLRITESNFPTVPKEQLREIVAEITKAIPED